MDYTAIISTIFSIGVRVLGALLNLVMENPVVGLSMAGVALLLLVFLSKKIASMAFSFTNIILIIALIIFIFVSLTALGYNVSKLVGLIPHSFNINDWLLNVTGSLSK